MNLGYAWNIANDLLQRLQPACERIEIAGSIRRECPKVNDIELVAIPKEIMRQPALFGDAQSLVGQTQLDAAIYELIEGGWMMPPIKNGPKYKQIPLLPKGIVMPIKLDLFIVTPPAQWGVQFVIRTGPNKPNNNFSQWMVTQKSKGGALPDGYQVEDGRVRMIEQEDYFISMPEESQYFTFCGMDYIEPKDRVAKWKR